MANPDVNPDEVGNALSELFPLNVRKKMYSVFVLLGFVIAVVTVAWAVFGDLPTWLSAVSVVWNFVSSGGFLVARSNVGAAGLN